MDIRTPKRGSDVVKLFSGKQLSPNTQKCVRIAAMAFDRASTMITMQDNEITSLREQVEKANPPKHRKVAGDSDDHFTSIADDLPEPTREPSKRVRKVKSAKQQVIVVEEESAEAETEQPLVRRSTRDRQRTQRYLDYHLSE